MNKVKRKDIESFMELVSRSKDLPYSKEFEQEREELVGQMYDIATSISLDCLGRPTGCHLFYPLFISIHGLDKPNKTLDVLKALDIEVEQ